MCFMITYLLTHFIPLFSVFGISWVRAPLGSVFSSLTG